MAVFPGRTQGTNRRFFAAVTAPAVVVVNLPQQFCQPMHIAYPLFLAAAVLVAACAPVQPDARPAVFTDAATGCRYAVAWDGRRIAVGRCTPRRWGAR